MEKEELEYAPETAQTPLLENMVVPPVFKGLTKELKKLAEQPLLGPKTEFPPANFACAKKDVSGNKRPQAIAHRGYKAKFPENTMGAFRGAIEVGADALETDVHLTKDGVVVLSHDKDLRRCFGRDQKIIDTEWKMLREFKTLKEPHESMPRLQDLLEYLAQPGLEDIWVLLDIKLDNDTEEVMRLIGNTIRSVAPSPSRPWSSRIVLGCWAAKYLPLCSRYLPGFPISHIGISLLYASHFFMVPNVSFNMLQGTLMMSWGRRFIRKAHSDKRPVFAWTVNEEKRMRWDIRNGIDGVITDDPKKFLDVRRNYRDGQREGLAPLMWLDVLRVNFFALLFGILFQLRFIFGEGRSLMRGHIEVEEE